MIKVSIICPIYNEEKYISKCIDSILLTDYPKEGMEVLFVDGMSKDGTRGIIKEYIKKYPFIKLIDNPFKIVPYAMNKGIKHSIGEVIIRIDAHCVYPSNYVSLLVKYLYELNADNVGGVWRTLPSSNKTVCRAIAVASSHRFGVGNSKHKIGTQKIIETDTVPFGCYRRNVFHKIGLFDEELIRNQDDEFNGRLIKNGGKIFLIPQVRIDYFARDTIRKMSEMYYQYGLFKPLVVKKIGSPTTLRQLFPVVFVLGLIFGAILSCFSKLFLTIYSFVIALYFGIAIICSIISSIKSKDWRLTLILPFVFFIIHLSYGYGYLIGIFKIFFKQKFSVEINR
ncbi:glycosyltransferase family 2 protein [Bacteroides sedimenti]|uniref:Glycosyl transferase n=1 Tax=Bacteroides sedimenti TaxID=2136147 RepID=A0ABN6Z775_9BACE